MSAQPLIQLEHVTKAYPGVDEPAVKDLNLNVNPGEILVLVGPSGCGKSTTLRLINRMIEPTSGRIIYEGEDVTKGDPNELRRRMGYVIQHDRTISAPDHRREHRYGSAAAEVAEGQGQCSRRRAS